MCERGWLGPIEWATSARAMPGERVSGDHSIAFDVDGTAALFGVVDGLGHGQAAATAALRAAEVLRGAHERPLDVLIHLCHRALTDTRGAAMTLARIDFGTGTLRWIGIGNVTASVVAKVPGGVGVRSSARLTGGIVGYRIPEALPTQAVSMRPGNLLIIATDGIDEDHLDSIDFAKPAREIAAQILDRHHKDTDDALVLAARHRGTTP